MADDHSIIALMPLPFSMRAFCICAIGSGAGCMRRPRARTRRSAPRGRDSTERDDGSGDDGDGGDDGPPPPQRSGAPLAGRRP
jgi:hypothetical protein